MSSGSIVHCEKVFLGVLLVTLLIFEFVSFAVQPYAQCADPEMSLDALRQLALSFLEQVAQVNLTSYNVTSTVSKFYLPQSIHYVIDVEINLQSGNDTLNFTFFYIDGSKLWWYDFSGNDSWEKTSNVPTGNGTLYDSLLIARQAIDGLGPLFNLSYCDEIHDMISTVIQNGGSVLSVENSDSLLNISYTGETDVTWYSKILGEYTNPKHALTFVISTNGFLTSLSDSLDVCPIATTAINVSAQEAINISMPYAQAYASAYGQRIVSTEAVLDWVQDSLCNRSSDDFAIYPAWGVHITFDKVNEQSMSGYDTIVWADNGQIAFASPGGPTKGPPKSSNSSYSMPVLAAVLAAIATTLALVCLGARSRLKHRTKKLDRVTTNGSP